MRIPKKIIAPDKSSVEWLHCYLNTNMPYFSIVSRSVIDPVASGLLQTVRVLDILSRYGRTLTNFKCATSRKYLREQLELCKLQLRSDLMSGENHQVKLLFSSTHNPAIFQHFFPIKTCCCQFAHNVLWCWTFSLHHHNIQARSLTLTFWNVHLHCM